MWDATGRWVITFNGEIYNYRALRIELEQLGCVFATNSDTEVLINAVAQWGEAGLSKLRGMYAFALWDTLNQELWLVRDPFGIKPLYVSESQGTIWFASQARALASCAPVDTTRECQPRSPASISGAMYRNHFPGGRVVPCLTAGPPGKWFWNIAPKIEAGERGGISPCVDRRSGGECARLRRKPDGALAF